MKKTELEKLITRITGLEPGEQLELANELVNELSLNKSILEDNEYDKAKSDDLSKSLNLLINTLQDDIKKTKLLSLISEVQELPSEYQGKLFTRLINLIHKLQKEYRQELILNECKNHGHIYTPWKEIKYERREENPALHSRDYHVPKGMEYIWVKYTKWERTCSRCHCTESVNQEPAELREIRLENERQREIKKLEKRLSILKEKKK